MGAGHHRPLQVAHDSPIHALAPECKLVAAFVVVFAVVATPRHAVWAFGIYAAMLAGLVEVAGIPWRTFFTRLAVELPFVAFAALLPVVGSGPHTDVLGVSLSVPGLWGAWNILVKGTLGVAVTGVLIATTEVRDLLQGLARLHVPKVFVAITTSMIRYAEVIAGELRGMQVARISRGHDPRWIWQARAVAATAGTLFIRSYERGERVHLAMVSRGYGVGDAPDVTGAPPRDWIVALTAPAGVVAIAAAATWA